MINNTYSLQLLSHKTIFATREAAVEYINDNFKGGALWAEPALFFYGNQNDPKMILAVGATVDSTKPRVCLIDDQELRELISSVTQTANAANEAVISATADLFSTIAAAGLTYDDNSVSDKVSYTPPVGDAVLAHATTLANAVKALSVYAQSKVAEMNLSVEDTDSVDLTFSSSASGSSLSAQVKVSTAGNNDELDFNNNLIGVNSDGLYATANLEYDANNNTLIFTASGYDENNVFKADGRRKIISLGGHTTITTSNSARTATVIASKDPNSNSYSISADVNISSQANNLLERMQDALYVSSNAADIYVEQNISVSDKISTIESDISDLQDMDADLASNLAGEISRSTLKDSELENKINSIAISPDANNANVYNLLVGGRNAGTVSYSAGNGLNISAANQFSVKLNNENESQYLSLSNEGLKLSGIAAIAADVATKANSADVYTKTAVDNFVDGLQDVIDANANDIGTLSSSISNANQDIADINTELSAAKLVSNFVDSSSVDFTYNLNKELTAAVRLDSNVLNGNILVSGPNGLYVSVTYDPLTNKLIFSGSNGVNKEISLTGTSLFKSCSYDDEHHDLILVVTQSGTDVTIKIPLEDLFTISVNNGTNNPIQLSADGATIAATLVFDQRQDNALKNNSGALFVKQVSVNNGVNNPVQLAIDSNSVLSASLGISTQIENNAIIKDTNGNLYVSKKANDMLATYNNETINMQTCLNSLANRIEDSEGDINDLIAEVQRLSSYIGEYNTLLGTISSRLAALESLESRITAIEPIVNNFADFNDLNNDGDTEDPGETGF